MNPLAGSAAPRDCAQGGLTSSSSHARQNCSGGSHRVRDLSEAESRLMGAGAAMLGRLGGGELGARVLAGAPGAVNWVLVRRLLFLAGALRQRLQYVGDVSAGCLGDGRTAHTA